MKHEATSSAAASAMLAIVSSVSRRASDSSSPIERAAEVREVVTLLRGAASPAALRHAAALEAWLSEGGDLNRLLGLRPRRGGAFETLHRGSRLRQRNAAIRGVAAGLDGPVHQRAETLAAMLRRGDPAVLVIRQIAEPPSSAAQIARILRSTPRD
ncbi:MAG: hypothetical protein JSR59_21855 [Proteobacteria bacterium]|nr:hypothetical protein [Pseudomonadota bacterium]